MGGDIELRGADWASRRHDLNANGSSVEPSVVSAATVTVSIFQGEMSQVLARVKVSADASFTEIVQLPASIRPGRATIAASVGDAPVEPPPDGTPDSDEHVTIEVTSGDS